MFDNLCHITTFHTNYFIVNPVYNSRARPLTWHPKNTNLCFFLFPMKGGSCSGVPVAFIPRRKWGSTVVPCASFEMFLPPEKTTSGMFVRLWLSESLSSQLKRESSWCWRHSPLTFWPRPGPEPSEENTTKHNGLGQSSLICLPLSYFCTSQWNRAYLDHRSQREQPF